MRTNPDKITLGSGKAYIMEYTGTMPEVTAICVDNNLLGKIQGGAELSYTTETHEERDDLGTVAKVIVTNEEAVLKLGLITFNGDTMAKMADRCKVTEDKTKGTRTMHIGGAGNAQGKEWVVCFHHEDKKDGDIWVMGRGANQAGLTLAFAVDAGSKLEPEIKFLPSDTDGTLVTYIENIKKSS
ncbi:MAG: hypothetical protein E7439_03365 [Ruminococcaceae bacterium]|nr:hypothetical protein [Oscillospiraceae bacterium]